MHVEEEVLSYSPINKLNGRLHSVSIWYRGLQLHRKLTRILVQAYIQLVCKVSKMVLLGISILCSIRVKWESYR